MRYSCLSHVSRRAQVVCGVKVGYYEVSYPLMFDSEKRICVIKPEHFVIFRGIVGGGRRIIKIV